MSEKKAPNLGSIALDKMFLDDKGRSEYDLPKVYEIRLDEIDDFPNHPFKVKNDEDMAALVDSIREQGLITPITVRPKEDGRYEIVSGHRRRKACEILNFETIKAVKTEISRDEAVIQMVDSNLQRSKILPSEKAFSYKMRLEAIKRLQKEAKNIGAPVVHPEDSVKSRDILASEVGENREQIRRYIRLTELIPELLEMVDEGKIALRPAVELSYLDDIEQKALLDQIQLLDATPSHSQAKKMRELKEERGISPDAIYSILSEVKSNQKDKREVNLSAIKASIPSNVPYEKTEEYIAKAVKFYQKYSDKEEKIQKLLNKNKDAR